MTSLRAAETPLAALVAARLKELDDALASANSRIGLLERQYRELQAKAVQPKTKKAKAANGHAREWSNPWPLRPFGVPAHATAN